MANVVATGQPASLLICESPHRERYRCTGKHDNDSLSHSPIKRCRRNEERAKQKRIEKEQKSAAVRKQNTTKVVTSGQDDIPPSTMQYAESQKDFQEMIPSDAELDGQFLRRTSTQKAHLDDTPPPSSSLTVPQSVSVKCVGGEAARERMARLIQEEEEASERRFGPIIDAQDRREAMEKAKRLAEEEGARRKMEEETPVKTLSRPPVNRKKHSGDFQMIPNPRSPKAYRIGRKPNPAIDALEDAEELARDATIRCEVYETNAILYSVEMELAISLEHTPEGVVLMSDASARGYVAKDEQADRHILNTKEKTESKLLVQLEKRLQNPHLLCDKLAEKRREFLEHALGPYKPMPPSVRGVPAPSPSYCPFACFDRVLTAMPPRVSKEAKKLRDVQNEEVNKTVGSISVAEASADTIPTDKGCQKKSILDKQSSHRKVKKGLLADGSIPEKIFCRRSFDGPQHVHPERVAAAKAAADAAAKAARAELVVVPDENMAALGVDQLIAFNKLKATSLKVMEAAVLKTRKWENEEDGDVGDPCIECREF